MNLKELGHRIRSYREKKRLTQSQLANTLHITAQAVSKWERGENAPDISYLPYLAKIFETSIEAILTGTEKTDNTFHATVFCTSIRNFAKRSSDINPSELALWVNGIFYMLTESVLKHNGVPIKYVGDGFLAYFSGNNCSSRAMDAAISSLNAFDGNELLITLHSGNIYLGSIGHPDYMRPDIMGDCVNKVFLMNQWATQNSKNSLLISENVYKQIPKPKFNTLKTIAKLSNTNITLYEFNI